jgi:nitrate reductase beta subunit
MAVDWRIAFPLHPEYRTLPMVWYVPPLSPIQSHANAGNIDADGELANVRSLRMPVRYLANLLTAGRRRRLSRRWSGCWRCAPFFRGRQLGAEDNMAVLKQAGLSLAQVEEMHRYLAIANYEDRFVIPISHREAATNAYALRGNCGFSFGNGCDAGEPKPSLFGGRMGRRKLAPERLLDD